MLRFRPPGQLPFLNVQPTIIDEAKLRLRTFYRIFPEKVSKGKNQTPTLNWLYTRCADGKQVVTPRDVLDLVTRAVQKEQDICATGSSASSDYIISPAALKYGLEELSKRKRETYLQAEFPHLWPAIERFAGGKTEYNEAAIAKVCGGDWQKTIDDLVSIGLFSKKKTRDGNTIYWVPYLYRQSLELTQGKA